MNLSASNSNEKVEEVFQQDSYRDNEFGSLKMIFIKNKTNILEFVDFMNSEVLLLVFSDEEEEEMRKLCFDSKLLLEGRMISNKIERQEVMKKFKDLSVAETVKYETYEIGSRKSYVKIINAVTKGAQDYANNNS